MDTRRLTEAAFQATFTTRMRENTGGAGEAIDIRKYVESVPPEDLQGLVLEAGGARQMWRDEHDRYEQVLLPLNRSNAFLVVVVDLRNRCIHGHHVLDLGPLRGHRPDAPPGG